MDEEAAPAFLSGALDEAIRIVAQLDGVLGADVQEKALGRPGEPGDAERINRLADRIISIYEDLLDWAARIRGTAVSEEFRGAFDIAARFVDVPIEQFRDFVFRTVESFDGLTAYLEAPEPKAPLEVTLELVVTTDRNVLKAYNSELKRIRRRRRWR
ncbi:MAG TPA: hypothetical protein VG318_01595 [Actinomycetota bacterium]|nr:hypothetical protein [Actinomycetota bacterium]